ncbi:MAG TPA: orotate phosphoribosyltransferase [Bryobacterales bacterium]|nr:orotate phosphoribosyltransferase [Bryobacterales bacterium]
MAITQTMTQAEVLDLCRQRGAYLRGHFQLTSGLHSPEYLQCARLLAHPADAERLGRALAEALASILAKAAGGSHHPIDFVTAPALGGLIIGHEVARAFQCRFLFTERDGNGHMALRRGFAVEPGERGVVVEDVITTGGSTKETIAVFHSAGATIMAGGSIIDRSGGQAEIGLPRVALATLAVETYPPESCPLCAKGEPLVKPGSRNTAS